MSRFGSIPSAPPNAVLGLALEANLDTAPDKIDLTVGAYKDDDSRSVILPSVFAAEERLIQNHPGHEYLRQDGLATFTEAAQVLMFGHGSAAVVT